MAEKNIIDKLLSLPDDGGEWISTQWRLLEAGFRNNDRITLQTAYNNMVEKLGKEFADDQLFGMYMEYQRNKPISSP